MFDWIVRRARSTAFSAVNSFLHTLVETNLCWTLSFYRIHCLNDPVDSPSHQQKEGSKKTRRHTASLLSSPSVSFTVKSIPITFPVLSPHQGSQQTLSTKALQHVPLICNPNMHPQYHHVRTGCDRWRPHGGGRRRSRPRRGRL